MLFLQTRLNKMRRKLLIFDGKSFLEMVGPSDMIIEYGF